ncbi:MAG TPA: hypothetical protein VF282_09020 [Bacillota bacterium]
MNREREVVEDLGWLDAALFVHVFYRDRETTRCEAILDALLNGRAAGRIDPITLHELTYALIHRFSGNRRHVAEFVTGLLSLDNVFVPDREIYLKALRLWGNGEVGRFGDAIIMVRSLTDHVPVCSPDRHFAGLANSYATRADPASGS